MTITTNPARNEYTSTAGQTVFNYTFKIYANTDLNVYVTPDGQDANDSTDLTTDYVVDTNTIGDPSGGFITFNTPLNLNDRVTIVSDIPDERTTDYQFNGDFQPDTVNNDFDRTVSLVKQLENSVNRTVQFEESQQGGTSLTLPAPIADNLIKWKSDLSGFENTDGTDIGGIAQAVADAEAAELGAQTAETNAGNSASAASTSATNAATSETNTQNLYNQFLGTYYGTFPSDPALDPLGNAPTDGDWYFNSTSSSNRQFNGASWQDLATAPLPDGAVTTAKLADGAVTQAKLGSDVTLGGVSASRNVVLNQDPLSQGSATRVGFSATTYTGNGTSQSISTGVDMDTGDFGGLVWLKERNNTASHIIQDTIRGTSVFLSSNSTSADASAGGSGITSFDANGFTVGSGGSVNGNTDTYISWSWQTTDKTTGTTNQNKAYTAHYNAELGFSIVGYVGTGVANHSVPHHLGGEPELSIFKNRSNSDNWIVKGSIFDGLDFLELNDTTGLQTGSAITRAEYDDTAVQFGSWATFNASADSFISYHFRSIEGVSKIGKYIGTGATGNYVDCGFKPAFVILKPLTIAGSWKLLDVIRGNNLNADSSSAEGGDDNINLVDDGFVILDNDNSRNQLNEEYIFLAFADTNATTGRTDYDYPTTADTLTIQGLLSYAEGFNASGEVNSNENVNTTFSLGSGFEDKQYYIYKDKDGSVGVTEYRPLEEQDYSGVQSPLSSDVNMRTTAKHFDYESSTGIASATSEFSSGFPAWKLFDKTDNGDAGQLLSTWASANQTITAGVLTTPQSLQYKHNEPRVLKSLRILNRSDGSQSIKRFVPRGSNDGLNWVELDTTYKQGTGVDYGDGVAALWQPLVDLSANNTAYLYHDVYVTDNYGNTANVGAGELELNTITGGDRYDITDGVIYNNAGTPIERVYLGSFRTDTNGDVINSTLVNESPNKAKINEAEIHGDLTVRGEIDSKQVATAWVNFDGTQNPPLIRDSYNVADVVDLGTGVYRIFFENMDKIGFVASGMCGITRTDVFMSESGGVISKDFYQFIIRDDSGIAHDMASVSLMFMGGKD